MGLPLLQVVKARAAAPPAVAAMPRWNPRGDRRVFQAAAGARHAAACTRAGRPAMPNCQELCAVDLGVALDRGPIPQRRPEVVRPGRGAGKGDWRDLPSGHQAVEPLLRGRAAEQFDAFVWFAETTAVTPLADGAGRTEGADTLPFGV